MKFDERQTNEIKKWTVRQLEVISDADASVLADYVLALLKSDKSDSDVRKDLLDNLEDFLEESQWNLNLSAMATSFNVHTDTQKFVQSLFNRYGHKPVLESSANSTPAAGPNGRALAIPVTEISKKRSYGTYNEKLEANQNQDKRIKRVGKATRKSRRQSKPHVPASAFEYTGFGVQLRPPTPPNGLPAIDPNDPISAAMAMQVMFPHLTGVSGAPSTQGNEQRKKRCRNYDLQGFCSRGNSCHFEHSNDRGIVPEGNEYDPSKPAVDVNAEKTSFHTRYFNNNPMLSQVARSGSMHHTEQNPFFKPFVPRSSISKTAIAVEQIPGENYDEVQIRDFFSKFGNITRLDMKPPTRLAIITYATHAAAKAAWESPKAVFDNRFVKVYWHRAELSARGPNPNLLKKSNSTGSLRQASIASGSNMAADDIEVDSEAAQKRRLEKQEEFEQRQRQLRQTELAKIDLLRRKEEILRKHNSEKAALLAKLSEKEGSKGTERNSFNINDQPQSGAATPSKTQALREHLAKLEAEAERQGIDPDAATVLSDTATTGYQFKGAFRYRGRGGLRGGRGRGSYTVHFGGGRTAFTPPLIPLSTVNKLDNRPRTIAVSIVDKTVSGYDAKMALLAGIIKGSSDCTVDRIGNSTVDTLVSFAERWKAEMVMNGPRYFDEIGKVEMKWVMDITLKSVQGATNVHDDEFMQEFANVNDNQRADERQHEQELDLDVAGDDDWDTIT